MTTEEMTTELEGAGKEIPEEATAEEIETLYADYQVEQAANAAKEKDPAPIAPVAPVSADTDGEPVCPIKGKIGMGDKDPEVIAWWKANYPDEFEIKYAGRTIPQI